MLVSKSVLSRLTSFSGSYDDAVKYCQDRFFNTFGVRPAKSNVAILHAYDRFHTDYSYPVFEFCIVPGDGRCLNYVTTEYDVEKR